MKTKIKDVSVTEFPPLPPFDRFTCNIIVEWEAVLIKHGQGKELKTFCTGVKMSLIVNGETDDTFVYSTDHNWSIIWDLKINSSRILLPEFATVNFKTKKITIF